jgi:hypothetical protein
VSIHVHYEGSERCPLCVYKPYHEREQANYHVHVGKVGGEFHVSVKPYAMISVENWASGTKFLSWWRKPLQILTLCGFNYVYQYPKEWRLSTAIKAAQRFCEIEQAKEERVARVLSRRTAA